MCFRYVEAWERDERREAEEGGAPPKAFVNINAVPLLRTMMAPPNPSRERKEGELKLSRALRVRLGFSVDLPWLSSGPDSRRSW